MQNEKDKHLIEDLVTIEMEGQDVCGDDEDENTDAKSLVDDIIEETERAESSELAN